LEVIGSAHPEDDDAPQQELPPEWMRSAACPYFSFTVSLMFVSLIAFPLFTNLGHFFALYRPVSRATFGVQKAQQLSKRVSIRGVSQKRALTPHIHQTLGFELFQVVGQSGIGNVQFFLNFADYQAVGVSC